MAAEGTRGNVAKTHSSLLGTMENSRRTSAQVSETEKMKEYELEKAKYIAAYAKALHVKLIAEEAALVEYQKQLMEYQNYEDEIETFGLPAGESKRDPPVKPKISEFYEVDVPGYPEGAPKPPPPQGGRRRRHTRRGRKHRSTRRR